MVACSTLEDRKEKNKNTKLWSDLNELVPLSHLHPFSTLTTFSAFTFSLFSGAFFPPLACFLRSQQFSGHEHIVGSRNQTDGWFWKWHGGWGGQGRRAPCYHFMDMCCAKATQTSTRPQKPVCVCLGEQLKGVTAYWCKGKLQSAGADKLCTTCSVMRITVLKWLIETSSTAIVV